jgi:hypothetical protein
MIKRIMVAAAAFAIVTGSIVTTTATAEAAMMYNPTNCLLFLPFLCGPQPPPPHPAHTHNHHHH